MFLMLNIPLTADNEDNYLSRRWGVPAPWFLECQQFLPQWDVVWSGSPVFHGSMANSNLNPTDAALS